MKLVFPELERNFSLRVEAHPHQDSMVLTGSFGIFFNGTQS